MNADLSHIQELIVKCLQGELTQAESVLLNEWMAEHPDNALFVEQLSDPALLQQKMQLFHQQEEEGAWQRLQSQIPGYAARSQSRTHRVHFLKTSWFRYAAAVILLVGGAAVWYDLSQRPQSSSSPQAGISQSPDIQPGTNRAILTVGNKTIDLATNKTGIAVGDVITYNDGSTLRQTQDRLSSGEGKMLQLTTPKGGQYQAVLPDGSKVWLNAASAITFPSKFTGDKREIEITGEVYIEVVQDAKQPFYVHTGKTDIQVLGTSFNINAYEDEEVERTTLIEGSVRINNIILQPGQQAQLTNDKLSIKEDQSDAAIAWKNGLFNFEGVSLKDAMKQLARWYDLEVIYKKGVPEIRFFGEISRNVKLSDLLAGLEKSAEVHFKVEDNRKLIVMP